MKRDILKAVSKHDGEWSWYQLDRALSRREEHLPVIDRLMVALAQLEEEGLIRAEGSEPIYWITVAGRQNVASQEEVNV